MGLRTESLGLRDPSWFQEDSRPHRPLPPEPVLPLSPPPSREGCAQDEGAGAASERLPGA